MSSEISGRNFGTFILGDNPDLLAGGLMIDLATQLGVVGAGSTELGPEHYQEIVGIIGKNKVLRDNNELTALSPEDQLAFDVRSGLQEPADRSLWTPEIST